MISINQSVFVIVFHLNKLVNGYQKLITVLLTDHFSTAPDVKLHNFSMSLFTTLPLCGQRQLKTYNSKRKCEKHNSMFL